MRSNLQNVLRIGIALCLGFTWACVKVDVTVTSQGVPSLRRQPTSPPPTTIDDLKSLHTQKSCIPSSLVVPKEQQETPAWCWAASARMVMDYHNRSQKPPSLTPLQCDIVRSVLSPWISGSNCCGNEVASDFIDAPSNCIRGAWPNRVLDHYQFTYQWIDGAIDDWDALKGELCSSGPFITVIEWSGGGKHAFVVKGYNPEPENPRFTQTVEVYDPFLDDPQDMTFAEFLGDSPRKQYEYHRYSHDLSFVQIRPKTKDQP
nr:papain-like cysteine protease family protein [Nitrosomonas nitrosa]